MGLAEKRAGIGKGKFAGRADIDPSNKREKYRRLKADAILLLRYGILAWTALLLILLVSLVGVVDFKWREVAGAVLTYAGVLAAIGLSVGAAGLLIWACILAVGRLKRLAARQIEPETYDRHGLWDEWLDVPGSDGGHTRI